MQPIKIFNNKTNECKRFSLDDLSFKSITKAIKIAYELDERPKSILYKDSDNDFITVSTDDELTIYLKLFLQEKDSKALKFFINAENKDSSSSDDFEIKFSKKKGRKNHCHRHRRFKKKDSSSEEEENDEKKEKVWKKFKRDKKKRFKKEKRSHEDDDSCSSKDEKNTCRFISKRLNRLEKMESLLKKFNVEESESSSSDSSGNELKEIAELKYALKSLWKLDNKMAMKKEFNKNIKPRFADLRSKVKIAKKKFFQSIKEEKKKKKSLKNSEKRSEKKTEKRKHQKKLYEFSSDSDSERQEEIKELEEKIKRISEKKKQLKEKLRKLKNKN